jgi:hypothetical protein
MQVTVLVNGDTKFESDEGFTVHLSGASGATISDADGTGTITNDDSAPSFSIDDVTHSEGNAGTTSYVFTVTKSGSTASSSSVNFQTQDGTATLVDNDYQTNSGTLNFGPSDTTMQVTVLVNGDTKFESDEGFTVHLSGASGATISDADGTGTINNDDAAGGIIKFNSAFYNTTENSRSVTITVERVGDTSAAATVDYATPDDSESSTLTSCATTDGVASPRCDFTTALGTLRFAAGDSTPKTFTVLISQDNYVEGPETLTLTLSNLTGGAVFGVPSTAPLTIADDATEPAANPIDEAENFVRQHYHDFLNREPDASGLAFWTHEIASCGADQQCVEVKRINVSAAFYLSIEFQNTGYFAERMYKASYGDMIGTSTINGAHQLPVPIVRFNEFLRDTQEIGQDVVVLQSGWEQVLENNKQVFALGFVQRSRFISAFPTSMTPDQFVDALFANAGVTPSASDRTAAINEFGAATTTSDVAARSRALRRVAEHATLAQQEFNRAFVLMEYFGYLRRNANAAPDSDYSGYDFWLTKLNLFNGNFINAEMVKAFLTSFEYRQRFGP